MDLYLIAILLVILIAVLYLALQEKKDTSRIEIFNKDNSVVFVNAELANTAAKRAKGLMGRQSLGEGEGMLFIFDDEEVRKFWMLNTSIPLDGIFFAANGTVVDIKQMKSCTAIVFCEAYTSAGKAKYVLEVNSGFAAENGIVPGDSRLVIRNWTS